MVEQRENDELAATMRQQTDENGGADDAHPLEDKAGFLKFTEKEILKMPKQFRKTFRIKGHYPHARKRTTGRYKCSYELRYAKKPFNNPPITASGKTLEAAIANFIKKLDNYVPQDEAMPSVPKDFDGFALYWFENFHKAKVKEKTYKNNLYLYNRHVQEKLKKYNVNGITPIMLKQLLAALPGNGKTEDDVHSILNQIFDTAVTHGLVKINPLNLFVHIPHECESGIDLTREEELLLLSACKGTAYETIFAVILYCGLRPNEYKTARIEGNFIVAVNSKQKNGKVIYKKIPICAPLRERLRGITTLENRHERNLAKELAKVLPDHTLKDLRKTFNTRCVGCHVDYFARKKFMGHSVGKLDKTYTGTLDDYLLTEGKKLDHWYDIPQNTPEDED